MDRNIGSAPNRDLQLPLLTVDTVAGYVRELNLHLLMNAWKPLKLQVVHQFSFQRNRFDKQCLRQTDSRFIKILGPSAELSKQRLRIERETFSVWKDALGPSGRRY